MHAPDADNQLGQNSQKEKSERNIKMIFDVHGTLGGQTNRVV